MPYRAELEWAACSRHGMLEDILASAIDMGFRRMALAKLLLRISSVASSPIQVQPPYERHIVRQEEMGDLPDETLMWCRLPRRYLKLLEGG